MSQMPGQMINACEVNPRLLRDPKQISDYIKKNLNAGCRMDGKEAPYEYVSPLWFANQLMHHAQREGLSEESFMAMLALNALIEFERLHDMFLKQHRCTLKP